MSCCPHLFTRQQSEALCADALGLESQAQRRRSMRRLESSEAPALLHFAQIGTTSGGGPCRSVESVQRLVVQLTQMQERVHSRSHHFLYKSSCSVLVESGKKEPNPTGRPLPGHPCLPPCRKLHSGAPRLSEECLLSTPVNLTTRGTSCKRDHTEFAFL